MKYSTIAVIYNPNSTGSSQRVASAFQRKLIAKLPEQKIELIATDHAGHAEELAYSISKKEKNPLIISSSGDGGYHEVINGALKAQSEGAHPTTGLLPAGNANDHYRNLHTEDIVTIITDKEPSKIDVLKLSGTVKGETTVRLAHSYIGFGLTPIVGKELNKNKLNLFNQVWIVARTLFAIKAVKLTINGKAHLYDSIIFSNIDSMSKVLTISAPSRVDDGKFEVTIFRKRNRFELIGLLLKASIVGIKEDTQVTSFELATNKKPALVQLDGEIMTIDAHSKVIISIEKEKLNCVV